MLLCRRARGSGGGWGGRFGELFLLLLLLLLENWWVTLMTRWGRLPHQSQSQAAALVLLHGVRRDFSHLTASYLAVASRDGKG